MIPVLVLVAHALGSFVRSLESICQNGWPQVTYKLSPDILELELAFGGTLFSTFIRGCIGKEEPGPGKDCVRDKDGINLLHLERARERARTESRQFATAGMRCCDCWHALDDEVVCVSVCCVGIGSEARHQHQSSLTKRDKKRRQLKVTKGGGSGGEARHQHRWSMTPSASCFFGGGTYLVIF